MNEDEICENCRFSYPDTPKSFFQCRRYAPKETEGDYAKFPIMYWNDFCGEFKKRMKKTKCIFCGNVISDKDAPWDEEYAVKKLVEIYPSLPQGEHDPECDNCWKLMQRMKFYADGEIFLRDKDWNWKVVRERTR